MTTKMWGGRFTEAATGKVEEYTQSESFDRALYREDIAGSKAHARMLGDCDIISKDEALTIIAGLNAVLAEIESGAFVWKRELEDVHMNIERRLTEIVGPVGGKLHTARSRNDQVGLDFRLHVATRLEAWREELARLVDVIADRAEEHTATLLPGCTHLQAAQPVSLAQHLLAYAQMFKRDHERITDCLKRVRISPLGAAALAGTTHPINPQQVAEELGFGGTFANSMDAVSDRDYALEALFCASVMMMHLSRMCEEFILWANPNFGYLRLPDAYSTGSSIMPQKKNPDVCELMRGKTGRVYGALTTLLTIMKGLPLTYNRDMQEDKEPFFDADRTVFASVSIMADMLAVLEFKTEVMRAALDKGFLNATELADYLAAKGLPFREAHHATGAAVAHAEKKGVRLEDLTLEEFRQFSPLVEQDVYAVLAHEAAVARRSMPGGTGPNSVAGQLKSLRSWLKD